MPIVLAAHTARLCPSSLTGAARPLLCIGTMNHQISPFGKKHNNTWRKRGDCPRSAIPRRFKCRITFLDRNQVAFREPSNPSRIFNIARLPLRRWIEFEEHANQAWFGPHSDKTGGLKGSMQHWLGVYPPEFEIPTFFVVVDSDAERSHLAPAASSRTDPPSSIGIAATIHSYFHSSRVARDFA